MIYTFFEKSRKAAELRMVWHALIGVNYAIAIVEAARGRGATVAATCHVFKKPAAENS